METSHQGTKGRVMNLLDLTRHRQHPGRPPTWAARFALGTALVSAGLLAVTGTALAQPARWTIVPSPSPNGTVDQGDNLASVSCVSGTDCVAAGTQGDSRVGVAPLIERWNGTAWSVQRLPGFTPVFEDLSGVSCVSADDCLAVGTGSFAPAAETLFVFWNGTQWLVHDNETVLGADLSGVSCPSADFCVTVGTQPPSQGIGVATLIESGTFDTGFGAVASPSPAPFWNQLTGVSCVSNSDCVAVGWTRHSTTTQKRKTLIESWNGTSWSVVRSPNRNSHTDANQLNGVSCLSAANCVAVGSSQGLRTGPARTLIETWNGSSWSITRSPDKGATLDNRLNGITCVTGTDCAAVGDSGDRTLAESWNGTTWTVVPSTNKGPANSANTANLLAGVSCEPTGTTCVAVGNRLVPPTGPKKPITGRTLIEQAG
jgi:hypothetical protein